MGGRVGDMEEEGLGATCLLLKGLGGLTSQDEIPPLVFLFSRTCEVGLGERKAFIYERGWEGEFH